MAVYHKNYNLLKTNFVSLLSKIFEIRYIFGCCFWYTLGIPYFASGDIDLLGLPFLNVTLEPRHYLYNVKQYAQASKVKEQPFDIRRLDFSRKKIYRFA